MPAPTDPLPDEPAASDLGNPAVHDVPFDVGMPLARPTPRSGARRALLGGLPVLTLLLAGAALFLAGFAAGIWAGSVPRPASEASQIAASERNGASGAGGGASSASMSSAPSTTLSPSASGTASPSSGASASASSGASASASSSSSSTTLVIPASGVALGDPKAPVTLELWADFQCPFCAAFDEQVLPWLEQNYVAKGTVRIVHRDLAFLGQESIDAAVLGRYAAGQNKFWQLHDALYASQDGENKGAFSRDKLVVIATKIGLSEAGARAAFTNKAFVDAVTAETAAARTYGVSSTPTLRFPDGSVIAGLPTSAQSFAAKLDAAVAAAKK